MTTDSPDTSSGAELGAELGAEAAAMGADLEYVTLLGRAERGDLWPRDFQRIDQLLPLVSQELRGCFGRPQ